MKGSLLFAFLTLFIVTACSDLVGTQKPAPYEHYGVDGGANSAGVHTVNDGDTLWSISNRYKVTMQDVIRLNDLYAPYALNVNQRLTLPPPNTYRVRKGDTIFNIARTFNVSIAQIAHQNNIGQPYTIHEGDILHLPSPYGLREPQQIVRSAGRKPARKATQQTVYDVPKRSGSKFDWPVNGKIASSYGPKEGGLHNDGINILAKRGTPVKVAENGVVVYTGSELKGYGNLVLVKHEDRWMTAYAHLEDTLIKKGQTIKRGQTLGTVGSSGNVSTPQLHFEVRRGVNAVNPKAYLARL